MKKFTGYLILFLLSSMVCLGQSKDSNQVFDAALSAKLGADEYGMKKYVFAFLKPGKAKIEDKKKNDELQAGHLKTFGDWQKKENLFWVVHFLTMRRFVEFLF